MANDFYPYHVQFPFLQSNNQFLLVIEEVAPYNLLVAPNRDNCQRGSTLFFYREGGQQVPVRVVGLVQTKELADSIAHILNGMHADPSLQYSINKLSNAVQHFTYAQSVIDRFQREYNSRGAQNRQMNVNPRGDVGMEPPLQSTSSNLNSGYIQEQSYSSTFHNLDRDFTSVSNDIYTGVSSSHGSESFSSHLSNSNGVPVIPQALSELPILAATGVDSAVRDERNMPDNTTFGIGDGTDHRLDTDVGNGQTSSPPTSLTSTIIETDAPSGNQVPSEPSVLASTDVECNVQNLQMNNVDSQHSDEIGMEKDTSVSNDLASSSSDIPINNHPSKSSPPVTGVIYPSDSQLAALADACRQKEADTAKIYPRKGHRFIADSSFYVELRRLVYGEENYLKDSRKYYKDYPGKDTWIKNKVRLHFPVEESKRKSREYKLKNSIQKLRRNFGLVNSLNPAAPALSSPGAPSTNNTDEMPNSSVECEVPRQMSILAAADMDSVVVDERNTQENMDVDKQHEKGMELDTEAGDDLAPPSSTPSVEVQPSRSSPTDIVTEFPSDSQVATLAEACRRKEADGSQSQLPAQSRYVADSSFYIELRRLVYGEENYWKDTRKYYKDHRAKDTWIKNKVRLHFPVEESKRKSREYKLKNSIQKLRRNFGLVNSLNTAALPLAFPPGAPSTNNTDEMPNSSVECEVPRQMSILAAADMDSVVVDERNTQENMDVDKQHEKGMELDTEAGDDLAPPSSTPSVEVQPSRSSPTDIVTEFPSDSQVATLAEACRRKEAGQSQLPAQSRYVADSSFYIELRKLAWKENYLKDTSTFFSEYPGMGSWIKHKVNLHFPLDESMTIARNKRFKQYLQELRRATLAMDADEEIFPDEG